MPTSPRRPCSVPLCPELLGRGQVCPTHGGKRYRTHDRSRQERGYGAAWDRLSRAVLERDGHTCAYCGAVATTADHVVPKRLGGEDSMANLVAACRPCNSRKQGRAP